MGKKNNAYLPNVEWMIQAGIDPKTKLPIKFGLSDPTKLKENIKKQLRIIDEQDAVNRGKWYNLPLDLSSQDVERMLYYKFKLCMFYCKPLKQFYILPFTLSAPDGNGLDAYGRYEYIKPICYNGGSTEDAKEAGKGTTPLQEYFSNLHLKVIYSPVLPEDLTEDMLYNSAVILTDYTPQYSVMDGIPRYMLQDSLLDVMSECIPFMRTSLLLNTGITGVRVQDGDQSQEVTDASLSMQRSALCGLPWIPLIGPMEMQELTSNKGGQAAQEYLLAMQGLENLRLSTYGIDNGGLFEKKAHELQSEADINGGPVGLVMQDCTTIRQKFATIVNSIWGVGLWYEPSETITKTDANGDGVMYDREDGNNSGVTNMGGNDNESNQV